MILAYSEKQIILKRLIVLIYRRGCKVGKKGLAERVIGLL